MKTSLAIGIALATMFFAAATAQERLPTIPPAQYNDAQKQAAADFLAARKTPVQGPFEPMMFLQSSVTRTDVKGNVWGPKQRISIAEALRVATINGARASFEEKLKGSIEVGKLADLVVLGRDPLREDPSSLVTIPVERTMVDGRWVWEA